MISQVAVYYAASTIRAKATPTQAHNLHFSPEFHLSKYDCGQSLCMSVNVCECDSLQENTRLTSLGLIDRSAALRSHLSAECNCHRCAFEKANSASPKGGFFLAIGCPRAPQCNSALIRCSSPSKSAPDDDAAGYKCEASECPGSLSTSKVEELYDRLAVCTLTTIPSLFRDACSSTLEGQLQSQVTPLLTRLHAGDYRCSLNIRLAVLLAHRGLLTGAVHFGKEAMAIRLILDAGRDTLAMSHLCTILVNSLSPALERQKKEKEPKVDSEGMQEIKAFEELLQGRLERVAGLINFGLKISNIKQKD